MEGEIPNLIAESYLSVFKNEDVDTVILGCTHYPLLRKAIKNILGEGIDLVDSGEATAEVVLESLNKHKILSDSLEGKLHFYVTDSIKSFKKAITKSFSSSIGIVAGPIKRIDLH